MDINNVLYGNNPSQNLKAQEATANYLKSVKEDETATEKTDKVSSDTYKSDNSSVSSDAGIYSKENIKKTIDEMETQRKQAMTNMISEMLGKQANSTNMSFLNPTNSKSIIYSQSDIDDAKSSISDNGYWSVDAVSTRIMDMAKMLANGDSSKLETLKNAVIKGFGGAMKALGKDSLDDMPDITSQTYDEVMKRFDDWEKSSQSE